MGRRTRKDLQVVPVPTEPVGTAEGRRARQGGREGEAGSREHGRAEGRADGTVLPRPPAWEAREKGAQAGG